ncbi:MAG TPA: RlmE family RNA methyltransferase [Kofleriaceae bacterium]|nr:RlmE family RNA methyltransferase [Kofleriaceae bacterium]
MSKLSDRRFRKDRFHRQAQAAGYRARAVFKLEEIDRKVGLLRPGARVLDLGCAPGSWLQYAAERVGPGGRLVGIDRAPIDVVLPNLRLLVGDVFEVSREELLGELPAFDAVLSDMAPDTTGIRHVDQIRSEALFERALDLATTTLAHGGTFLAKLFQGPEFQHLVARCRREFSRVKIEKPAGSRAQSIEQYVAAIGFHAP